MTIPPSANLEFDDRDQNDDNPSPSAATISDIQFWIDHPSLDNLTAAQAEPDRQQVRRDVEECIRLLSVSASRIGHEDGKENLGSLPQPLPSKRYTILKLLGVGAFGIVLHARDRTLNRDVAIKILRPSVLLSKQARARFTIEGESLARCNCPGIVPVYEVGNIDGHPYLIMGLIQGVTLAEFLKNLQSPVAPADAAVTVAKLSQAVHQAHQRGILHRDLKPSNILLHQTAESQIGLLSTPFVSDFGLAKDLLPDSEDGRSHVTVDSPIIGTVRYMSPEQATGRNQEVAVTSDVFSLGVILYQMLTLQCPFNGETTFEIIQQVATATPKAPRQINPKVSRDLNAIVGRCLSKLPTERYQSARELADDLNRFLEGRPVVAKPAGPMRATLFWAKRNPSLALASTVIWFGLLISTITISLLYNAAREANKREDISRRFALTAIDDNLRYVAETVLRNVPQSAEKKLALHLRSLKTNEEYAEIRGHDDESMYRLNIAHHYVANDALNCQQFELASVHRQRCLEIVEALAAKDPENAEYQFDIFMNRLQTRSDKMSKVQHVNWLHKARKHLQSAISLSLYNPDYEEADAAICVTIGHAMLDSGQENARDWFAIAVDKLPELAQRFPAEPKYYKHAIEGHLGMAKVDLKEQKWESARVHCISAMEFIDNHFRNSRDNADIETATLSTLGLLAQALEHLNVTKAIEAYEQYITVASKFESQEKKYEYYRIRRADALLSQAKLQHQLADNAASKALAAEASMVLKDYVPNIESAAVELADLRSRIADFVRLLDKE